MLSLISTQLVGGYKQSAKVYLPPDSYSYSDTGMFEDDDGMLSFKAEITISEPQEA